MYQYIIMRPPIRMIIFMLCGCFGCQNADSGTSDFKRLIPDTSNNRYPLVEAAINLSTELNLHRIDRGVDSFEFRLWLSNQEYETVYIVRFADNEWLATVTDYWVRQPNIGEKGYTGQKYPYRGIHAIVDSSRTKRMTLSITYVRFLDSLQTYDIENIPSQKDIPGFKDLVADGFTYAIEISTRRYYKLLSYHSPGSQNDQYGYNLKITLYSPHFQHQL